MNREVDAVLSPPDVVERVRGFGAESVVESRAFYTKVIADGLGPLGPGGADAGVRAE